jgi:GT2 family glycosyltransferase
LYILIDNSPTNELKILDIDSRIAYIHNPANPGFGASHNVAIENMKLGAKYHFIVNPDIYFEGDVVTPMVQYVTDERLRKNAQKTPT